MASREDLGSWLEGTPGGVEPDRGSTELPPRGPGSVAGVPRRLAAVAVDWLLGLAISGAFFPASSAAPGLFAGEPLITLAIFAASTAVLVGLLGHTIGHRLLGLRVVRLRDVAPAIAPAGDAPGTLAPQARAPGLGRALLRTLLLCLVVPAVIWDGRGRGMHDVAAGTVVVKR